MRLRASICFLKLAHVKTFDKIVSQQTTFELVGGAVQVSYHPRRAAITVLTNRR